MTAPAAQSFGGDQTLAAFYTRRHPYYDELALHWKFLNETYVGGRSWFSQNIFPYHKEGPEEFQARINRAYRFNHTREVVDLVQKYLFKAPISRNTENAPQPVLDFWKSSTLSGLGIDQLAKLASTQNSVMGVTAVTIDNNFPKHVDANGDPVVVSIADAKTSGGKIYGYTTPADDILDYAFDEDGDGEMLWIKLREWVRDDTDPLFSTGLTRERVRLWTRQEWAVFDIQDEKTATGELTGKKSVVMTASEVHGLGMVPVRLATHTISTNLYRNYALIDEIAYLDRAVANYLSNLDAIIQDQTFSQLAIPAQSLVHGDKIYNQVLEMGTKRVFVYDAGTGSAKPEYLSPDPKQAGVILAVIEKIINEIYHTVGLAGERTKQDNATGIDNSSGVAKAYDFERVNALLLAKSQSSENLENWMVRMVMAWSGDTTYSEKLVTYPTTFDVMRLVDELVTAESLMKVEAPIEIRRHQMRGIVDKIFPQLKKDIKDKILADINSWKPASLNPPPAPVAPAAQKSSSSNDKPAAAPSRQGSVTANTKP